MSKTACIPYVSHEEAVRMMGPLPSGIEYVYWPTSDAPVPDESLDGITFFAPDNVIGARATWLNVIPRMPNLKVLQLASAGFEHALPVMRPGLSLHNAAGVHDSATAETAVLLALSLMRDIPGFFASQRDRSWDWRRTPGLAGKTILIFGYGRIGKAIEKRLAGFEPAEIIRVARRGRVDPLVYPTTDLESLLPAADVVILQCPSNPQTDGLFDAAMLGLMKDGAVLVNTARGAVVNTDDLLAELRTGRIYAGLDVVAEEPLPRDHPLWTAPNTMILPHVGSTTHIEFERYAKMLASQLRLYAEGKPLDNVVI